MANTQVDFNDQLVEVSLDGGTTFKTLVCLEGFDTNFTNEVTETETQCGVVTGVGETKAATNYTGTCNTTPETDEISFTDLLAAQVAKTIAVVRVSQGTLGADWYYSFSARFTNLVHTGTSKDVMKFNGTCTSTGLIDLTPPTP